MYSTPKTNDNVWSLCTIGYSLEKTADMNLLERKLKLSTSLLQGVRQFSKVFLLTEERKRLSERNKYFTCFRLPPSAPPPVWSFVITFIIMSGQCLIYIQGGFFNWSALKMTKCQTLRKFWHLELFWRDLHVIWPLVIFRADQLKKPPCICQHILPVHTKHWGWI